MSKSNHFIGQPSYLQLLKFIDSSEIRKIVHHNGYDRYTKRFDSITHLKTFLYAVLSRYDSIREVVVGLLSNASRLHHLGINYASSVARSLFPTKTAVASSLHKYIRLCTQNTAIFYWTADRVSINSTLWTPRPLHFSLIF